MSHTYHSHSHIARQQANSAPMNDEELQRERQRIANSNARLRKRFGLPDPAAQKPLEISQPGDEHEKEADAIADKVVNGGEQQVSGNSLPANNVQRKEDGNDDEEKLMAKSEDGTLQSTEHLQAKLDSSKGGGQSLDDRTKEEMEEKMDADLSDVRIHTGSGAHEMAQGIHAKAFTHGQDVYFKDGNYDPDSEEGKKLLAHELAHTQQQKGGVQRMIQRKDDGVLQTMARAYIEMQPSSYVLHYLLDKWNTLTPAQQEKVGKQHLYNQAVQARVDVASGPPWWTKLVSPPSLPGMPIPAPSLAAIWPYLMEAQFGYYMYLYRLPAGKYPALIKRALQAPLEPDFLIGSVEGVFQGIWGWVKDLWGLVELAGKIPGLIWKLNTEWIPNAMIWSFDKAKESTMWLSQAENRSQLVEFIGELMNNPEKRGEISKSFTEAGASMARMGGMQVAKAQESFINQPFEAQGQAVGKIVGYIIPEILLAVASEGIGNLIKGAAKGVEIVMTVLKAERITEAVLSMGRIGLATIEKMWSGLKIFAKGKYGKLRQVFDDILGFLKGLFKGEKELPKELPAGKKTAAEEAEHLKTGKKEPVKEKAPSKEPSHEFDLYKNPLRIAYEKEVGELKGIGQKLLQEGKSKEEVARTLHKMRRDLGIKYKDATPPDLRKFIYEMNKRDYGDELGPTIEYLQKIKNKSWDDIIESASKPGQRFNREYLIKKFGTEIVPVLDKYKIL